MPTVNTVLGPIDADALGFTMSHEHLFHPSVWRYLPFLYDLDANIKKGVDMLAAAKQDGVDSVIELSTIDLGREVGFMREIAEAAGVNVVVATGLWLDIPRFFWGQTVDYIARFMFHEIEHGIDDTGIKPGVIKMANDIEGVTEAGEKALRAAARVAKATGVPISTHHAAQQEVGRRQVEIFLDEGVPMHLVCIGHSADTTDDKYLEELLQTGCYVSMDRYPGRAPRPEWQDRNATVKRLVDRGWAGRLMLGHDTSPRPVLIDLPDEPEEDPVRYSFVKRIAIPALLADGVTEEQIRLMTVESPRRFLTGAEQVAREQT